jgi:hypothetical protein
MLVYVVNSLQTSQLYVLLLNGEGNSDERQVAIYINSEL